MGEKNSKLIKRGIIVTILVIIAIIVYMIVLSKNGIIIQNNDENNNTMNIAGKYKIIEMISNGENMNNQIEQMNNLGMYFTLELKDDGTGIINILGEEESLTYNDKTMIFDGDEQSYVIDEEGNIVLENDETKLVFSKMTEEELNEE